MDGKRERSMKFSDKRYTSVSEMIRDVDPDFADEFDAYQAARHKFTLTLDGVDDLSTEVMNALYEAGCDDATPCRLEGRTYVMFTREAASRDEAIASALGDVERAGFRGSLVS